MTIYNQWAEFGEGKYPDCHYEGRSWPGSLRELVLEGFASGTYLRQLYPSKSIANALSNPENVKIKGPTQRNCKSCKFWMKSHFEEYVGVCTAERSLASTVDTVEAQFSCNYWEG